MREHIEDELAEAFLCLDWLRAEELQAELDAEDAPPVQGSPLSAALWYAEQGLRVFPCQVGQKVPYGGTSGVLEATEDEQRIRTWWGTEPQANVALATGHVIDVIDFDGERGHASWGDRFGGTWGTTHVLGTVSTPRAGGLHVYVPANGSGNRAAMLPGVDYRGAGGYVLAPPSRTAQGTYRFVRHLRVAERP